MKLLRWAVIPAVFALLTLSSCSKQTSTAVVPSQSFSPTPVEATSPVVDTFEAGLAKASDAAYVAKTAETKEDWELAAVRWQSAIVLMQSVPKESANHVQAPKKIVEYQGNLKLAQSRKKRTVSAAAPIAASAVESSTEVKSAGVSISGFFDEYMDAVVNRGSSGYEYWCSQSVQFQSSFFSPRSWRLLDTHTAPNGSGGSFTIQLDSSNKGGSQITASWLIVVEKEKNKTRAKNLPGGWCVTNLWER